MAGFNLPITMFTPQMLAEMAKAAFRPPALMSGGGGGGGGGTGSLPQSQGFNVGQGMAGAGQGLGMLAGALGKGGVSGMPETAAVSSGDLAGTVSSINALQPGAGGVWAQPTMPTNIGFGGGLADGGPVEPGKYYTVGERGPETFVPAVPGHIVPGDGRYADYPSPDRGLYADYPSPDRGLYADYPSPDRGLYADYPSPRDFFGGRRRR